MHTGVFVFYKSDLTVANTKIIHCYNAQQYDTLPVSIHCQRREGAAGLEDTNTEPYLKQCREYKNIQAPKG